jgi:hypothetical protein
MKKGGATGLSIRSISAGSRRRIARQLRIAFAIHIGQSVKKFPFFHISREIQRSLKKEIVIMLILPFKV